MGIISTKANQVFQDGAYNPPKPGIRDLFAIVDSVTSGVQNAIDAAVEADGSAAVAGGLAGTAAANAVIGGKLDTDGGNFSGTDADDFAEALGLNVRIDESPVDSIIGLNLSRNALTGSVSIDISSGSCRDSESVERISLAGSITKNTNSLWALGSNLGGLDEGTLSANTWYHVHIIKNGTTGTVDVLFSTSPSNPNMPSGFNLRRYLGSVLTDGGNAIRDFIQSGDYFAFKDSIQSVSGALNGVPNYQRLSSPPGMKALVNCYIESNSGEDKTGWVSIRDPDRGDYANVPEQANFFKPSQFLITTLDIMTDNQARVFTGVTPINSPNLETISIRTHSYVIDRSVYR